ncbi:hypothetical protein LTR78_008447 [Recurvomyces mirabilis]|uniref:Family c-likeg-protein-coupled receptor protein n=1 Tax=Recurvomyces mirabilis TaxID=574656 RepID=A0AAE0WHQ0_9PEZI|nr:hypothetical protein LTR78_008447 [Recurvomyces mirabilis]KAK5155435.1 hypothetical protein LTS14_005696 [Recurvomyces mirabilis]
MSQSLAHPQGPPYPSHSAGVGGLPTAKVDVPISAILMVFYLAFAILNQATFQLNRRRKHKFLINWVLFGFCMCRVLTFILRIVWATRPHNVSVAIAANIFVNAGILLIYIINFIFALRIFRARQPELGWNRALHYVCVAFYWMMGIAICLVISMVVVSSYTLKPSLLHAARDVLLAGLTVFTVFTALAPAMLITSLLLNESPKAEHFGKGEMRMKIIICGISCALALLIAGFRCGTTWQAPRPMNDPAWYDNKAAFYCFEFVPEIMILVLFAVAEIHLRFHVPNGSSKVQSYATQEIETERGHSSQSQDTSDVEKDEEKAGESP